MSDSPITPDELAELRVELDALLRDGTSPDVAAGPNGVRPANGDSPDDDEILLPRGVWGSADSAALVRRALAAVSRAEATIAELQEALRRQREELDAKDRTIAELQAELAAARADAELAGARPRVVPRTPLLR